MPNRAIDNSKKLSAIMGDYLLKGWRMLDAYCTDCQVSVHFYNLSTDSHRDHSECIVRTAWRGTILHKLFGVDGRSTEGITSYINQRVWTHSFLSEWRQKLCPGRESDSHHNFWVRSILFLHLLRMLLFRVWASALPRCDHLCLYIKTVRIEQCFRLFQWSKFIG